MSTCSRFLIPPGVLLALALCTCSCCPLIACNSILDSEDTDYEIEVALIGECASLQGREFHVNSKVQTELFRDYEDSAEYDADLCDVSHFMLCTPDRAAFLDAPLEVVVMEAGTVLSEQTVRRPGCQHPSIEENCEYVSLFIEADGTVRTDFGVHPLVTSWCDGGYGIDCRGRNDLEVQ